MSKPANVDREETVVAEGDFDAAPAVDVEQFRIHDIAAYARAIAHGEVVQIFDTTLRDGEQSPGATLNIQEKLEIAHQLARLGVDIMEAGFPAASPGDLEAVRRIANTVGRSRAAAKMARLWHRRRSPAWRAPTKNDIDKAWEAVQGAVRPRIHTFLATSDIHMEHKLRMTRDEVLETVGDMVQYARSLCSDVEFSPEDGGRSDPEFLVKVLSVAIQAGATTLNIPDTVGYVTPEEYGGLIRYLRENVAGGKDVIFSCHCHNDLGLATANTLAGVQNGARQIEVTLNGIGERAGNTSLEETAWRCMCVSRSTTWTPTSSPGDPPHQRHGQPLHRHGDPAQQGHRRRQCLCPRGGHPPGRHVEAQTHLRDHGRLHHRAEHEQAGAGQTFR
jgi:hypothetical protein